MSYLVLVRHGESTWNDKGLWTGQTDVDLDEDGIAESKKVAQLIKSIPIDKVFTSKLMRAQRTAKIILDELHLSYLPISEVAALDERDYGIYVGRNKWEIEKEVGEKVFEKIRRGWDYPIPGGETIKDVYHRVVPYFENNILPELKSGISILISAHGNSLRALTKYLKNLSAEEVENLEFGLGEVHIYTFNNIGKILSYEIRGENPTKGKI